MAFLSKILLATLAATSSAALAHSGLQFKDLTAKQQMASQLYRSKKIVLTVDDGPSAYTMEMLNLLREHNVKASFFVIGKKVQRYVEAMKTMSEDGHIIANHTFTHEPSTYQDDVNKVAAEMTRSHEVLSPYLKPNHKLYFRAPQGKWKPNWFEILNSNSLIKEYKGPVFWDIGGALVQKGTFVKQVTAAADWDCWRKGVTVQKCAQGYLNETNTKGGGIMLMHDVDKKSVELLKILIPELLDQGYEFISLDDVKID